MQFQDAIRTNCLVASDEGSVENGSDEIVQVVLSDGCRPTTNRHSQKTIQHFRDTRKVVGLIEQKMAQDERGRFAAARDATQANLPDRLQVTTSEAETYVRWKQLKIEQLRSHDIRDQQQVQMIDGQIAAEQQRMKTRTAGTTDRLRALEDQLARLSDHSVAETLVILVRVLPSYHLKK